MRTTARLSVATAALGVLTVAGAPAALAQTAEYPGTTDTGTQDTGVLSGVTTRGQAPAAPASPGRSTVTNGRTAPSSLPFTGGEVVLIAAAGAAAVAAGAGMVVGGRRRGATAR